MYIYYKGTEVKMISDKKLESDKLDYISKTLSKTEKEKLFNNKNRRQVVDKKLTITEPIIEPTLEDRVKTLESELISIKEIK